MREEDLPEFRQLLAERESYWLDAEHALGRVRDRKRAFKELTTDDTKAREVARNAEERLASITTGRNQAESADSIPPLNLSPGFRERMQGGWKKINNGVKRAVVGTRYWARRVWDGPSFMHGAKGSIAEIAIGYTALCLVPIIALSTLPIDLPVAAAIAVRNFPWFFTLGRRIKATIDDSRLRTWKNNQRIRDIGRTVARHVGIDEDDPLLGVIAPDELPPRCATKVLKRDIRISRSQVAKSALDEQIIDEKTLGRRTKIDRYYAWAQLANWEAEDIKFERQEQTRELKAQFRQTGLRATLPTVSPAGPKRIDKGDLGVDI